MTETPAGYATVNPFLIAKDAEGLIAFVAHVFDGIARPESRTVDGDGLLLHAELQVGGATLMFAERKPDWPYLPALLQVYVDDVPRALERAKAEGAEIVTEPTEFFGDVFSRFLDPWGNLWWVYSTTPAISDQWSAEGGADEEWGAEGADAAWEPTPELVYIHDTLIAAIPRLKEPGA